MRTLRCSGGLGGGCLPRRGGSAQEGGSARGWCLPRGGAHLPPVNRMTANRCKNITSPQLRLRTVKMEVGKTTYLILRWELHLQRTDISVNRNPRRLLITWVIFIPSHDITRLNYIYNTPCSNIFTDLSDMFPKSILKRNRFELYLAISAREILIEACVVED